MATATWSSVFPETEPVAGGPEHPSVRYSTSGVLYHGDLILTHGGTIKVASWGEQLATTDSSDCI